MKKIGLVLDNPRRDLTGITLLASQLADLQFEVSIIPMYQQGYEVPLLDLDAIVLNYVRPTNYELIRTYANAGIQVYVLDTEGGVLWSKGSFSPKSLALSLKESGVAHLLSGYFFWGEELRSAFVQFSSMPEKHLHLTGCPRFDVCADHNKQLSTVQSPYFLINTNFPSTNPKFSRSDQDEIRSHIDAGWSKEDTEVLLNERRELFPRYLDALEELFSKNPDLSFFLRPHPFESESIYRKRFGQLQNVRINAKGEVLSIVRNCTALIHLNCSTAIEANMLGRLSLSLEYLNTPFIQKSYQLPSTVSYAIQSFEELNTSIRNIASLSKEFPFQDLYQKHIEPWFYKNDGLASRRVAEILSRSVKTRRRSSRTKSIRHSIIGSRPQLRASRILQGVLNQILGSERTSRLRELREPGRKDKKFTRDEVFQIISKEKPHSKVNVKTCDHPLFRTKMCSIQITKEAQ